MPKLLATDTLQSRLLHLISAIGAGCEKDTLDPDLLREGLQHQVCREVLPVIEGQPVCVYLTATGLQRSLEAQKDGHLLLGIDITRHGLTIRKDLTFEQWCSILERLRLAKECYHTALSDLIRYGRQRYSKERVDETLEQLMFPFDDVNHAEHIGCVPRLLREQFSLTSEHYYILGLLFKEDTTSQEMWGQRAVEHQLSPNALRRSIEAGQIITDADLKVRTGGDSGIPVLQAVSLPFTRWQRALGGLERARQLSQAQKVAILDELKPIVDFALALHQDAFPEEADEDA